MKSAQRGLSGINNSQQKEGDISLLSGWLDALDMLRTWVTDTGATPVQHPYSASFNSE